MICLQLKRMLPNWLKNPTVISVDLQNLTETVSSLPLLDSSLVELLKRNKISHFFPGNFIEIFFHYLFFLR